MNAVRVYGLHVAAAIRVALADRSSFLFQLAGMVVNNGFVLLLWFMFFSGFKSVGGWRLSDMALLIGLLATTFGVSVVAFGGFRDLAGAILRGEPDPLLTQPRGVLWRLLGRESLASGWGDIATGTILLVAFAKLGWADLPGLLLVLPCAIATFVSAGIAFASLAFWARGARSFARDLTDFVVMFSSYPAAIYSGSMKLVVYTVFPAGFVVFLPVRFLRAPTPALAFTMVGASAAYVGLSVGLFQAGLQRYRRGEV